MAYEVKIYGDIDSTAGKKGCCSLVDVQNQLSKADGQDVRVRINSYGGDVDEGFAIYSELRRYASENHARVITMAEGRCASIATVIFLAGDERIVSRFIDPFVHNAWTETAGNAQHFRQTADELERVDKMIAQHYAEHTNLSFDQALQLMGEDTSLKPSECESLRFATRIETVTRPLALKQILNNYKPNNDMNTKNRSERKSLLAQIKKALGFSNKLVFTADSKEIDFYELGEDEIVEAGAKATIDGQPAEGEYTVPDVESGMAKKYVFANGTLESIEEIEDESTEDIEALKAELETLKADNETLNAEAESTAEVLNALNEKYEEAIKEKNVFQAQAKALQTKVNSAKSVTVVDLKEKNEPETKSEVSNAILAYKESKFKNKK